MHRNDKYGYHKVTDITMRRGRRRAGAASGKRVPAVASPPSSAKGPGGVVVHASRRGVGPGAAGRRQRTSGAQARSMSYVAGEQGTSGAYRRSAAAAMRAEKGIATSLGLGGLGRSNAGVACGLLLVLGRAKFKTTENFDRQQK